MSQVRDIKARISLDGESAFRKALSMSNNSLKAMRSELNTVTSEFNMNDDAVEKAAKAQEILRKMQEQSAQKIEALSDAVEYQSKKYLEAQDAANKAAKEYGYTSEQAIAARKAADDAASSTDKYSKMLYAAQGEANKLNSELQYVSEHGADAFDDINDALDDVEDGTGKASDGFTVMKGVAANLYTEGIQLVTDGLRDMYGLLLESDSAVGNFAAKTGTAAGDMGKYTDMIHDIYESGSGESLTNVSDTMAMVIQQFGELNDADLSGITENTLTLEKYFGYDVQEQLRAAKMLTDQFGVSADEAFSMIVQGAQSGLDKNGDLLDSINEYSVHYKQLGYDADDFFNSLANGTASGTFSVDKLGDAMKEFGIRSKDTADSTTKGFELIGLNADDMRNKFSQGGETAKQAMNETITALFNMDDQVKMNQAGVNLFGTMWEDLGKEGILALSNVNGKIKESTESLDNINKIKFNSLETRVQSVGRCFKSEITQPIVEKALPKVETAIDYLSENMDGVIGTVKKVGEAMKIALAAGTVTKFVSASVTGISSVVKTIQAARDAQLALNAAQKANLFGLLAGLAVGAGIAIYDYYQKVEESLEPVSLLTDETNTLCEKLQDQKTAWDDAKKSIDISIGNKNAEFSYYQDLKTELDTIVDSSGKIKSGYEDRAKFITEKLGDVTGTEIEIVDDTIQKYDELSQKLDEVLTKKKGEAYASIYADQFSEALANKDSSLNDLMDAQSAYNGFRVKAIYADSGARNLRIAELEKQYATLEAYGGDLVGGSKVEFNNVRKELNQLKQEAEDENALKQALINAEDLYSEYSTTIANYENLQTAISSGTKEELDTAMYYLEHHFATAETATDGYLQRQSYRINNELSNAQTAVKNGMAGVTQEDVDALQDMNIKSGVEWRKATNNARASMDQTVQAASELGGRLWSPMAAAGYTIGDSLKNAANATNMPSVFDSLIAASRDLAPTLYDNLWWSGNMIDTGLLDGMESKRSQIEASVAYTANMITDVFNNALGIASPSKKFAWAAEMSIAGYVNQANDQLSEMEQASVSMAKAVIDPFQGYLLDHSVSPDLYANAAIDTADRINSRQKISSAYSQMVNVNINLNGLSIGNINNEDDVRKFMQRIASETQKAVFVTGGNAK